jgi:hypothetical protein
VLYLIEASRETNEVRRDLNVGVATIHDFLPKLHDLLTLLDLSQILSRRLLILV